MADQKMLVLFENATGYSLFQVLDESKMKKASDITSYFDNNKDPKALLKLHSHQKFEDTNQALAATTKLLNGKLSSTLKKALNNAFSEGVKGTLAVSDHKIGSIIKEKMTKLDLQFEHGEVVSEIMRGIKANIEVLLEDVSSEDLNQMRLGLAHSFSRYKLKFSPDKVDTMIVHAVSLLDEIDKELNNYVMRLKEWYGWHFPELAKVVPDAMTYAKLVIQVGFRVNYSNTDLEGIVDGDIEAMVKQLAEISTGTLLAEEDIENVNFLAEQIVGITDYRNTLSTYLRERMNAIAPNLTAMVGDIVGARLISHAGSLLNLAKHPASTVQILGAEKALFRALKTKKDTPKYGLIYHASLVSQCSAKNKGKMSRMLAAKASLACRHDALAEETSKDVGVAEKYLLHLHTQLNRLEGTQVPVHLLKTSAKKEKSSNGTEVIVHDDTQDSTLPKTETKTETETKTVKTEPSSQVESSEKKKKKKKKKSVATDVEVKEEAVETPKAETSEKKKKKKRKASEVDAAADESVAETPKKKKKKSKKAE